MANKTGTLAAVLAMTLATGRWANADEPSLTIEVRVVNHAELPDNDLFPAQAQATRIFEAVGVALRWVSEQPESEPSTAGRFTVRLILLSGERANRMLSVQRINEDVLGLAVGPARIAYIFCDRILASVVLRGMSFVGVLGRSIAHELGHIVLPSLKSHSDVGIMRTNTRVRSDRPEYFTNAQGALIRTFLRSASQSGARSRGRSRYSIPIRTFYGVRYLRITS